MGTENVSSNTRSKSKFYNQSNPKTVRYRLETLRCLGPKIMGDDTVLHKE